MYAHEIGYMSVFFCVGLRLNFFCYRVWKQKPLGVREICSSLSGKSNGVRRWWDP